MKRINKIFIFIILILSLFGFDSIKVNAAWVSDANGAASTYLGGGTGGCTSSGYALMRAALLQVCLVDINSSSVSKDSCIYYKSSSSKYFDYFSGNSSWAINELGVNTFTDVLGDVTVSSYNVNGCETGVDGSYCWWDDSPSLGGATYDINKVNSKFLQYGKPTDFFVNMVKELLIINGDVFSKNINDLDLKNLSNLTNDDINKLSNYRIIVEPVYGFGKKDPSDCSKSVTNFVFATIKGIAEAAVISSKVYDYSFGTYIGNLYNNNFTNKSHGILVKNDTGNYYADLADPLNTRGYSIYYAIPEDVQTKKCLHEASSSFLCEDGNKCSLNTFITECGCNKVNSSILTPAQLTQYNSVCEQSKMEGNLYACTGSISEDYSITYYNDFPTDGEKIDFKNKSSVWGTQYCKLTCEEIVKFNSVEGRYTTIKDINGNPMNIKAGMYFEINKYPETIAYKKCTNEIYLDDWYDDYEVALNTLASTYTNYTMIKHIELDEVKPNDKNKCCTRTERYDSNGDGRKDSSRCVEADTSYYYEITPYEAAERDDISFEFSTESDSFYTCDDPYDKESKLDAAESSFIVALRTVEKYLETLDFCNSYLYDKGTIENFYKYVEDIEFYYNQQVYDSNTKTIVTKNSSKFKLKSNKEETTGNDVSEYKIDTDITFDLLDIENEGSIVNSNPITAEEGNRSEKKLVREAQYKFSHSVEKTKYTQSYSGVIQDYNGADKNLLKLGYIYEVDLNAVHNPIDKATANTNNTVIDNRYYYEFKDLGDKGQGTVGQIYKYYNSGGKTLAKIQANEYAPIQDIEQIQDLKMTRVCQFSVENATICFPGTGDPDCTSGNNPTSKILYKIVDPANIDPNKRIEASTNGEDKGFQNWIDKNAVINEIKQTASEDMTFSPENLEYSFELDSETIMDIREYNDAVNNNYLDYNDYKCSEIEEGNYCLSNFIDVAVTGGILQGVSFKSYAKIGDGRTDWKVYDLGSNTLKSYNSDLKAYS